MSAREASRLRVLDLSVPSGSVRFTGRESGDLGSLTHMLVGTHVRFANPSAQFIGAANVETDRLLARLYAVAYAVIDANPNATRVLATEAAGLAYGYLTHLAPVSPWRLLGVEYDTGEGPVDLAWVHVDGRVFFDELKTSRVHNPRVTNPAWVRQATRYADAGTVRFGAAFAGVRLIALNAPEQTRLHHQGAQSALLDPAPDAPLRPFATGRVQP